MRPTGGKHQVSKSKLQRSSKVQPSTVLFECCAGNLLRFKASAKRSPATFLGLCAFGGRIALIALMASQFTTNLVQFGVSFLQILLDPFVFSSSVSKFVGAAPQFELGHHVP